MSDNQLLNLKPQVNFLETPEWTDLTPETTRLFYGDFIKKYDTLQVQGQRSNIAYAINC